MLSLLLAVLLLLGLIVVTGGLRPVPQTPLATLAVDQISRGEPWNVTVTGARLASDLTPAAYLHDRAHHWVAVIAEVEITAPESRADLLEVVRLRGIDGLGEHPGAVVEEGLVRPDAVLRVRDAASARLLHPGLPEQLVFLWERASDAPPPPEVTVLIIGMTWRESSLTGAWEWLDAAPRAQVMVPLVDQR